jgi:hypothetical protein
MIQKKTVTSKKSGNEQNICHSLKKSRTQASNHPKQLAIVTNNPTTFILSYSLLFWHPGVGRNHQ